VNKTKIFYTVVSALSITGISLIGFVSYCKLKLDEIGCQHCAVNILGYSQSEIDFYNSGFNLDLLSAGLVFLVIGVSLIITLQLQSGGSN
jgi:hypothetical protein